MLFRFIRLQWLLLKTRLSSSPFVHYQLGALYERGIPPARQDFEQALFWYRKAATSGNREAQYALGALYLDGQTRQGSAREGLRWIALAAQHDERQAIKALAEIYRAGTYGIEQDPERARYWQAKLDKEIFAD